MEDLISIIIPVYNSELYLEKCILSLINQTYENLEIIIVIDGSTDSSRDIAYKYKNIDNRIRVVDRENKGALYSRIEGVKNSKGKYISFVDSDDYVDEKYIEVLYENIKKFDVDIVRCHYKILKNDHFINESLIIDENTSYFKNVSYDYIYEKMYNSIYFNSMCRQLVERELFYDDDLNNIDKSINYGEDILYQVNLINRSKSIMIITDYLYIYNHHNNNVTFTNNIDTIYKKFDSVCKVNYSMYNNITSLESKIKNKLYEMSSVKFFYNVFNQYVNIVKAKGNRLYIEKFYNNEIYNIIFNNNMSPSVLKSYNIFYRIGINMVSKKRVNLLFIYVKFIFIPLLKLKR